MFAFVLISPLVSEAGSVSLLVFEQGSTSLSPNIEISATGVPGLVRETQETHQGANAQICDEAKRWCSHEDHSKTSSQLLCG